MSAFKHSVSTETTAGSQKSKRSTYPQPLIQPLLNLYINFKTESAGGKLLVILFFILPWNLGKHFELVASFIDGVLSSYLIPTLYLQDILIVVLLAKFVVQRAFAREGLRSKDVRAMFVGNPATRLLLLFLASCFLSLFFSDRLLPSLYLFCRVFLYSALLLVCLELFKKKSIRQLFLASLLVNLLLLCFLGLLQFANQKSVFSNYLFFGEQPYNVYTPCIAKESYGGVVKIPPYGLFEHPNILAGHLCVSLTLLLGVFIRRIFSDRRLGSLAPMIVVTSLGLHVLLLTKSFTGIYAFVLGATLLSVYVAVHEVCLKATGSIVIRKMVCKSSFLFPALLGFLIILAGVLFPFFDTFGEKLLPADSILSALSVDRRTALLKSAGKMVAEKPFYGWGLNSFVHAFQQFYVPVGVVNFVQPVHNVYALLSSEVGLIGAVWFVALTLYGVFYSFKRGSPVYGVVLLEIIFMSSFDHYFFTIHQTFLLFILTLGFALTYTKSTDCL